MNCLSMTLNSALVCAAVGLRAEPAVDHYGQCTGEEWPGKITSDEQFRADAAKEWTLLKDAKRDPAKFDRYGGVIEAGTYKATGFFRLEKVAGRWWFITPEGHRFFLIGADAMGWNESGYGSPLSCDGKPRAVFSELPDRKRYPDAYLRQGKVNFLGSNLHNKYGEKFAETIDEINLKRLLTWGFNSSAKWGWGVTIGVPYIEDSSAGPVPRIAKQDRAIDMYNPRFAAQAEPAVKAVCDRRRNDPMLIAYSMENENGWSEETVDRILKTGGDCHAKAAFLDFLAAKRANHFDKVAALFGDPRMSREELLGKELSIAQVPAGDVQEFVNVSSQRYHEILRGLFRKHDPNHLFMGAAHCSKQSVDWYEGAAKYVDFLGFNIYGLSLGWVLRDMERLTKADTPFTVLEYSFVQERRGFRPYAGGNTVNSERNRGIGYRLFTENAAVNPLCLGFGYFIWWDQPVTRRNLPNGESYNFGLFSQQDQPYYEMLEEVKKANDKLFPLHNGQGTPFQIKNPRSILGSVRNRKLMEVFLPGTMSEAVIPDPSNPHFFNGETARLKVDENAIKTPGTYYAGVIGSGDGERFTGFNLTVYLWKKSSDQDLNNFFVIEESSDGEHFTPAAIKASLTAPAEFNIYELTPANGLKRNTMYLRIGYRVKQLNQCWAAQIGKIKLEK